MLLVLGTLLLMLKLAGVIYWSWWIVLIPFYPVLIGMGIFVAAFIIGSIRLLSKYGK